MDRFLLYARVNVSPGCGKRGRLSTLDQIQVKLFFSGVHLSSQVRKLRPRDRAVASSESSGPGTRSQSRALLGAAHCLSGTPISLFLFLYKSLRPPG